MRAFVSVDVTDAGVLAAVDRAQRRLRDEAGARPVGPAPIHFTLCFLGDVPDGEEGEKEEGGRIAAALASIRFKAFNIVVVGVGAFPSARRPRAVWVGADAAGGAGLAGLAASVAGALRPLGPAAGKAGEGGGRPFRPHATICRVAGGSRGGGEAGRAAAAAPIIESLKSERFGTQRVGSFKLKKSVLSPGGAVHTDVAEVAAAS